MAIGPVGSHRVVAHVAAGLQQGEATGQVGGPLYGGSRREPP